MKRLLVILAAAFAVAFCSPMVYAQRTYSKECRKSAEKAAKNETKQLRKEPWSYNGSLPLQDALTTFYLEIGPCGGCIDEPPVIINGAKTINIGTVAAEKSIQQKIVSRVRSEIKGVGTYEVNEDEEVFDDKVASKYKATLINTYKPQFSLYKVRPDGKYDVKVYFTIDREKLERLEKKMLRDYENIGERSNKILDSVKDEFDEG